LISKLTAVCKELSKKAKDEKLSVLGLGIGCAGQVDQEQGIIKSSPNILCLEGTELGKIMNRALGLNTVLGNDVQFGLWGEHQIGIAVGYSHLVGVFFGTGVGGAAIIDGNLYEGASGVGGQVGGILAQPVGGPEAAQSHGIVDRIASKSAIAGEAAQMAAKNWAPYLHEKVGSASPKSAGLSWPERSNTATAVSKT
jgi:glucokinase